MEALYKLWLTIVAPGYGDGAEVPFDRWLQVLATRARPALAAGVFLGILLPPLAALCRPLLTPAVIGTLTAALLRLDWRQLRLALHRPVLLIQLALWQLLLSPLLVWLATQGLQLAPAYGLALILQCAAPPIGAAAAFVLLLGADAALALLVTVVTVLLLPLSLTALVVLLPGYSVQMDLLVFFGRVALLVLLPFVLASALRRWLGEARLARQQPRLEGLNVLLLVVFAIAVMNGVTARLLADPAFIGGLLALACAMTALLHLGGWLAFAPAGRDAALAAAVCSGNRNMGLMLAVTAGTAGETFALYVGVAQIPMYFAPLLIGLLAQRAQPG